MGGGCLLCGACFEEFSIRFMRIKDAGFGSVLLRMGVGCWNRKMGRDRSGPIPTL